MNYKYLKKLKHSIAILFFMSFVFCLNAQQNTIPDFTWGNAHYYNLNIGESVFFNGAEVKLLDIENHYNQFKIKNDTIWLKVSRRSLPQMVDGLRIFVADNRKVKSLTSDSEVHGLLTKDVLVCISDYQKPILNPDKYIFPINFNDGFLWNSENHGYLFTYLGLDESFGENYYRSNEGIIFDLNDARGIEKHWLVAIENSTVVWIETKEIGGAGGIEVACVLLESDSQPGTYYIYDHLYAKNLEVKERQKITQGELIGTIWGDLSSGFLQFVVVKSDSVPEYKNRYHNVVNFFPQMYQLYYKQLFGFSKTFTKGRISFGKLNSTDGNNSNLHAFEEHIGKGWNFGNWNATDRVDYIHGSEESNVRLKKELFSGSSASCVNPSNWYEYEINVLNGVYRIRAEVGDLSLPSWQKIEFEGVEASTYELNAGEYKWTNEKVVKINDRKITVRIYVDGQNRKVAGLSEVVFQQAY